MIDTVIRGVVREFLGETGGKKGGDIQKKLLETAKPYYKYLLIFGVVVLVGIILLIWFVWSLFSGLLNSGAAVSNSVTDVIPNSVTDVVSVEKIQEVGINGILEQPIHFLQQIWYGNDGK